MSKRKGPLKVFRTAIGFHDAYVAAPSKKAALEAWGTDKNLFGRGVAELVTDPKLTEEPLASPGQVIRRSRGGLAEQLAASPAMPKQRPKPRNVARPESDKPRRTATPKPKPKPRPARGKVDHAEAAIAEFKDRAASEKDDLRKREEALREERSVLVRKHRKQLDKLERQLADEEERYRAALDRWRID